MKKLIIAAIAVATLSITSCKKEEVATPSLKSKTLADQRDNGTWDVVGDQRDNGTWDVAGDQRDNGTWDVAGDQRDNGTWDNK